MSAETKANLDAECEQIFKSQDASGVFLIVADKAGGFKAALHSNDEPFRKAIPNILRDMARRMEQEK